MEGRASSPVQAEQSSAVYRDQGCPRRNAGATKTSSPLSSTVTCARLISLSRFSPPPCSLTQLSSCAALCVQSDGVEQEAIPDIVFSYLTPAGFGRYSSSNLCLTLSSLGRHFAERLAEESISLTWADCSRIDSRNSFAGGGSFDFAQDRSAPHELGHKTSAHKE
jgi:hypothetical protein